MKKKTNHHVLQGKKSFKNTVIDHIKDTQKEVIAIKKDMNEEIEKEVTERLGDYVHRIESALNGVIALKEMFIEKGFISREEFNKQMATMRKN